MPPERPQPVGVCVAGRERPAGAFPAGRAPGPAPEPRPGPGPGPGSPGAGRREAGPRRVPAVAWLGLA